MMRQLGSVRKASVCHKGTLAVVILAKQHGLIPSLADVLRSLLKGGFHLDEAIIREVLSRAVDEEWG